MSMQLPQGWTEKVDVPVTPDQENFLRKAASQNLVVLSNWCGVKGSVSRTCTIRGHKSDVETVMGLLRGEEPEKKADERPALALFAG